MKPCRSVVGVFLCTAISGCAPTSDDDVGAIEQHGTAAQDVEVALLRRIFLDATNCARPDADRCYAFAPAARYVLTKPFAGKSTRTASTSARVWSCTERDARKDSPQLGKAVTYEFTADAEGVKLTNAGSGFGKVFVAWENAVVGYPAVNVSGPLVTHDVLRHTGSIGYDEEPEAYEKPTLIFERVLRPVTASLSAVDQKAFDDLSEQYAPSTSISGGLAVAYVHCTSWVDK